MSKKIINFNLHSKYLFTKDFIQYLGIEQKPYTIDEISINIKCKIFNGYFIKDITWEEYELFNLKLPLKKIRYSQMIFHIINNFIIKETNEPDCNFYYYYQIPVQVKKIDL
jgi:hypothetical protein